ncbi:LysR family transcriptional regulator [Celerinatantimonas sp. MCCC 1A17872]|uniref:LysR family transcriptional regulator n=1 Tax=Celerinatantimonas sp. MCCC 1A17872 TaxID=3177514 RepID=UPI0038C94809
MTHPDFNLLAALDALLSEQSVVGAAKHLKLSTSAMSRTLARLRQVTGDPLLVRSGRQMVLTPYAQSIRERTRQTVFDALDILTPEVSQVDFTTLERTFVLRANEGFIDAFASSLIMRVAQDAPHVRLSFMLKPEKSADALREGRTDLEIGVLGNNPMGPEIRIKGLFHDRFIGVVRRSHPLANAELSPERYTTFGHIVASRRGEFSGPVDKLLQQQGLSRRIVATVPGFPAAISVAKSSDLIALVPASFLISQPLNDEPGAALWAFELPVATDSITISMMWHPRLQNDSAHRWLRDLVQDVCQKALAKQTLFSSKDENL